MRAWTLGWLFFLSTSVRGAEGDVPRLLTFVDNVAETAGIGLLRDTPLPDGEQELRVWTGFGVVVPKSMVRIRVSAVGKVSGQVFLHHRADLEFASAQRDAAFQRWQMGTCRTRLVGAESVVCETQTVGRPRWLATYRRLLRLGVLDLPDQSVLPKPTLDMSDGWALVVEVRRGAEYRAYQYSNPALIPAPEAQAAEQIGIEISRLVGRVIRN